jgi:hypothetical protein
MTALPYTLPYIFNPVTPVTPTPTQSLPYTLPYSFDSNASGVPITAFEVLGTGALFDINGVGTPDLYKLWQTNGLVSQFLTGGTFATSFQTNTFMATALNPALVTYVNVPYANAFIPMSASVNQGTAELTNLINNTPGKFVMWAWSQGGIVASNVYDEIRTGSLSSRNSDFLGAAIFGNPRRQHSHTFPLCPDPGGAGVEAANLLTNSETRWFDFANPGDLCTCTDTTTIQGQAAVALLSVLLFQQFDPTADQALFTSFLSAPLYTVVESIIGFGEWWYSIGLGLTSIGINLGTPAPHLLYGQTTPLAPADTRTCAVIAVDYMHSLALGWNACTVAPVAVALGSGEASVAVSAPTWPNTTYTYTVNAFNVTTQVLSAATVSSTVVSGGTATITVTGLTVGDLYTFSVTLGTTYTSPAVTPTSMASNSITLS